MYSFVQSCAKRKDLMDARRMQCSITDDGHDAISFWNDHLIRLFADCGSLNEANRVFCKVVEPTVFTWNAIISAHEKLGEPIAALGLYAKMQENRVLPDVVTYLYILKACSGIGELDKGRLIHDEVTLNGLETDVNLGTTLISMYAKSACLEDGRHVFDTLSSRNVVSWGAMIAGYVQNSEGFCALELFQNMQEACVEPSVFTYSSTLKACGSVKAIHQGRLLHDEVLKRRYELDLVIGSTLVNMYVDCGCVEEAHRLFKCLPNRDVVSWDIMISGYVAHGQSLQALEVYAEMQGSKVKPNSVLYLSLLQACGNIQRVDTGRSLHHEIVGKGLDVHVLIQNTLIDLYAKCGFLAEALELFEYLEQRDVVSWGALISGFTDNGYSSLALEAFDKMVEQSILPNRAVFLCSLKACGNGLAYGQGRSKHEQIVIFGLDGECAIDNALVDMYVQFSCLEEARTVFDRIEEVGELSWGLMLAGYANNSQVLQAFEIFDGMGEYGLKPNAVILLLMLNCCSKACAIRHGRQSHMHVISNGLHTDAVLGSAVVAMYSKCGNLKDARKVFDGFPCKDVVLYGSVIDGYAQQGHGALALKLFVEMVSECIEPSKALFLSLLKASSRIEAISWGFLLHHYCCESCLNRDVEIGTSLLDLYAKCSYLEESYKIFDELETLGLVSCSAMILGCMEDGQDFAALELYVKMQEKGIQRDIDLMLSVLKACMTVGAIGHGRMIHGELVRVGADSDSMVRSRLRDVYAGCGMVEEACKVLEGATSPGVPSSCQSKAGLNQKRDDCKYGRVHIKQLIRGSKPMDSMFSWILAACSRAGMLREACYYYNSMTQDKGFTPNIQLYSSMVDLLGRTGHLDEAEFFVKTLPLFPDTIMWISLLTNSKTHTALGSGRRFFRQVGEDYCALYKSLNTPMILVSERGAIKVQRRSSRTTCENFDKVFMEHNSKAIVSSEGMVIDYDCITTYKDCLQCSKHGKVATEAVAIKYRGVPYSPQCSIHENILKFAANKSSSVKISNNVNYVKSFNPSLSLLAISMCFNVPFFHGECHGCTFLSLAQSTYSFFRL